MTGREMFKKYKWIVSFFSFFIKKKKLKSRYKMLEKYNFKNSKFSLLIRYLVIKNTAKKCGDNVYIGKNVVLKNIEHMEIGSNVSIHEFCYLDGGRGLTIGDNVSIAHGCSIIAANHGFERIDTPFKYQELFFKNIKIGNNVWIGAKTTILAGATICDNVVIGAASLCSSKTILESWGAFVGNPIKKVKEI